MDNSDKAADILSPISQPYLLSVCVPLIIDDKGQRWCNELWAKDLALHLDYLSDVTLMCPRIFAEPTEFDVPLNAPPFDRLKFIDLPAPTSHRGALTDFPELFRKMWGGVRKATIVHTGFGGWPISEGWLVVPMAKLKGKFVITNVESSFWRVTGPEVPWYQRVRAAIAEALNRFCLNLSDLRLFTSKAYAESLLKKDADRAYVVPATWVDEKWILTDDEARSQWSCKMGHVRLLFAARLISDKGVKVLINAIRQADRDGADLLVSIMGTGPLLPECAEFVSSEARKHVTVELLEPVKYGAPFLKLLRGYDAVLIPSVSDEQPRLIFDAFSQAVPILGSDTGGIREVVDNQTQGRLISPSDVDALAGLLGWASQNRPSLEGMGKNALAKCQTFTHRSMHKTRHRILLTELVGRPTGPT